MPAVIFSHSWNSQLTQTGFYEIYGKFLCLFKEKRIVFLKDR